VGIIPDCKPVTRPLPPELNTLQGEYVTFEQLEWGAAFAMLPYIYGVKLMQAHTEFMEELFNVVTL
jgi:hypothetical protein